MNHYRTTPTAIYNECFLEMYIILSCIGFMNCQNIEFIQHDTLDNASNTKRKRAERNGYAGIKYYTLDVKPIRKVYETIGGLRENGYKVAFHKCRGHFADYTKGNGLFGKYKGIYWISDSIKGVREAGEVTKEYNLKIGDTT